jgi:hypothetical protein
LLNVGTWNSGLGNSKLAVNLELELSNLFTYEISAALAHVQIESIHPFLDGNGRVGRLLIPLILRQARVSQYPPLLLSLFFKEHRARYYELLQDQNPPAPRPGL